MERSRLVRPHEGWTGFDFGVAVVGLATAGIALWGAALVVAAVADTAAFNRVCGAGECTHHGVVMSHTFSTTYTRPGYCTVTMELDGATTDVAIQRSFCTHLADGSPIDADIWRGQVVVVTIGGQRIGTPQNPEAALLPGGVRLLGLPVVFLCMAIIHFDMQNHPVVRRMVGRSSQPGRPPHGTARGSSRAGEPPTEL